MGKNSRVPQAPDLAGAFLEFFYPIHYQFGKALEDVMRDGRLTRKHVAILWLIHSEGTERHQMLRKDLQHQIESWFEISRPAMTQTLRAMARPPLNLVRLAEAPNSGREQIVSLTSQGIRHVEKMTKNGKALLKMLISELPEEEARAVLNIYQLHVPRLLQKLEKRGV